MKKFVRRILAALLIIQSLEAALPNDDPGHKNTKVLVLIIASDTPLYNKLQKLWKSYMHLDREHVEAYFIKADPNLQSPFEIHDDVLWTKTTEGLRPGVLNKTILSFEAMLPRIKNEFDYVLRTNLSSFYVFPRLLKFLETLPKKRCYSALIGTSPEGRFGAGAGFILSPDLVELMVENKHRLLNKVWGLDDVVIGRFLQNNRIDIIPAPRMDFSSLDSWNRNREIPDEIFHFRVKNSSENRRIAEDLPIHAELIELFYK